MTRVTDFYQFKYSRSRYYMDFFISRGALLIIEEALDERLSSIYLSKDSQCAYMRLREQFQNSRISSTYPYVEIRINKCYLKYINSLYEYFNDRYEYIPLKVLSEYLYTYLNDDLDNMYDFTLLNENIKINILSNI